MIKLDENMNLYNINLKWIEENVPYVQMKKKKENPETQIYECDPTAMFLNDFDDLIYQNTIEYSIDEFVNKLESLIKLIKDSILKENSKDCFIRVIGGNVYGYGHEGEIEVDLNPSLQIISRKERLENDLEVKNRLIREYRMQLQEIKKEKNEKEQLQKLKAKYENGSNGAPSQVVE